jgi:signal transduction histidine kinase
LFHATVQSAQTTRHVNPIVLKNGSERQIEWRNKTLTDSDGNPLGVLAIGQDITRRLLVERELEQAKDAAERANSAKSRFLAAASHDLRQPMHALSLMIAALSARDLEPVSKQIVSDMKSALQVTGQLLNALLDISKLESNTFVPDRRMFNAAEFLDNLRKQFAVEAKELGVAIRIFPSRAILHTDIDLLGRIVQNFLSNAIHHGCGQKILVGCRRSGKNWRIEVWDRGQGIDQEHLEKIFEEFFQLNNPARNINKGLGLGLAISKRIAALLQLEVKVRSRPGRGSMFAVEVPAGELIERLPAESRIDEPDGRLQGRAVLVVDDDSRVLKAANYLLDSWGMRPTCVSNVEQTLALLSRADHRFDIVLLDFCLQDGWNGLQLYSEICRRLGNRIPALLLTGDLSVGRLREVQESGMSILYKPIDTAELYRLMREVIAD